MAVEQTREDVAAMTYPMRCARCRKVHDAAKVEVLGRYTDCSTWRCPNCNALIDDRPESWGGSAEKVTADDFDDEWSWLDGEVSRG